eukprot:scaffold47880_cov66-Cyclotella_meneghiniana.AAC.1
MTIFHPNQINSLSGYSFGQTETSSHGRNESLALAACREFTELFHLLYENRNIEMYPQSNPMQNVTKGDFVQFPTNYNFAKTVHGVVSLNFGTGNVQPYDQSSLTNDEIFSIDNPKKCMTAGYDMPVFMQYSHTTVKVSLPRKDFLHLTEVQVYAMVDGELQNVALESRGGVASQSSTRSDKDYLRASIAIDGVTTYTGNNMGKITHTEEEDNPWWQVVMPGNLDVRKVVLWNRQDGSQHRLAGAKVSILGADDNVISEESIGDVSDWKKHQSFEFDFSTPKSKSLYLVRKSFI